MRRIVYIIIFIFIVLAWPTRAQSACHTIPDPNALNGFRAAVGWVSQPFADPSEQIEVRPSQCVDPPGQFPAKGDLIAIVLLKPWVAQGNVKADAVLLAEDCADTDVADALTACGSDPSVIQSAVCRQTGLVAVKPDALELKLPAGRCTPLSNPTTAVPCYDDADCGGGGSICDIDGSYSGPIKIVVIDKAQPAPPADSACLISDSGCADSSIDTHACVDELYKATGCETDPARDMHPLFGGMVQLPTPNDYATVCPDTGGGSGCTLNPATGDPSLRFALGVDGSVLLPMNWTNVLGTTGPGTGLQRRVRASTAVVAFPGQTGNANKRHVRIPPGDTFVDSFSHDGKLWLRKPEFTVEAPPNNTRELALSGTIDQKSSVLRIARRVRWKYQCEAGAMEDQACEPRTSDCGCPPDEPDCCALELPAMFYVCEGGRRHDLACTRPRHCPPITSGSDWGKCLAPSPAQQPLAGGNFDLSGRKDPSGRKARLSRKSASAANGFQFGVCEAGDPDKIDQPCPSDAFCGANGLCVVIRAGVPYD
jgi:hypothetical protein